jgi:hypothetical protein
LGGYNECAVKGDLAEFGGVHAKLRYAHLGEIFSTIFRREAKTRRYRKPQVFGQTTT